jgi:hypothetical protein
LQIDKYSNDRSKSTDLGSSIDQGRKTQRQLKRKMLRMTHRNKMKEIIISNNPEEELQLPIEGTERAPKVLYPAREL